MTDNPTTEEPSLDARFAASMGRLLGADFPTDIGLAVSGGGDSMAMLYLAHNWTRVWGLRLWVCTVDHGLRPEAAAEAEMVAATCARLGWPHAKLRWSWNGKGNVMDRARQGRLECIDQWRGDLRHVLMAHTQDDVAETFLMRLARGSGVDGLAAMRASREIHLPYTPRTNSPPVLGKLPPEKGRRTPSYHVVRPLLDVSRSDLRHYLKVLHGPWVEDPTNTDPTYERARIRSRIAGLEADGLGATRLAETAQRMARVSQALAARTLAVWQALGQEDRQTGDLLLARDAFACVERETQLRLLSASLQHVAGGGYPPREAPLEALLDLLLAGGAGTLHGCEAVTERAHIRIFREYAAVAALRTAVAEGALWDGRWSVHWHETLPESEIRALGHDGWVQAGEKPASAPSYRAARSLPALWQGERLVACSAIGFGPDDGLRLTPKGRLWTLHDVLMQKTGP